MPKITFINNNSEFKILLKKFNNKKNAFKPETTLEYEIYPFSIKNKNYKINCSRNKPRKNKIYTEQVNNLIKIKLIILYIYIVFMNVL